jgi:hypothetical protein
MAKRLVFAMTNPRAGESGTLGFSASIEIGRMDTFSRFAVVSWSEGPSLESSALSVNTQ